MLFLKSDDLLFPNSALVVSQAVNACTKSKVWQAPSPTDFSWLECPENYKIVWQTE